MDNRGAEIVHTGLRAQKLADERDGLMLWFHKKGEELYDVLTHDALIQCSTYPEFESAVAHEAWTLYGRGGHWYTRMTREFLDGRFVPIFPVEVNDE